MRAFIKRDTSGGFERFMREAKEGRPQALREGKTVGRQLVSEN